MQKNAKKINFYFLVSKQCIIFAAFFHNPFQKNAKKINFYFLVSNLFVIFAAQFAKKQH